MGTVVTAPPCGSANIAVEPPSLHADPMTHNHYPRLLLMGLLSFAAMYVLMYAMVDSPGNVYANVNQVYMAALMTAPMIVIELLLMGSMYGNRKLNTMILVASVAALALFWMLIRSQAAVTDGQFLRSMIPHHGGAVLMCREAQISDPAVKDLCRQIVESQLSEIALMKQLLGTPGKPAP
jgi:uncharacterized protein (DUF305 family)